MSNKSEFYALLKQTKTVTQDHMRKFVKSHPGVLWRHAGKDNFQVKFRHTEQWQDVSAFCDNYASRLIHSLETALNDARKVLDEKEVLDKLGVQETAPEPKAKDEVKEESKVNSQILFNLQETNKRLSLKVQTLERQLKELDKMNLSIQKDRDEAVEKADRRIKRMQLALEFAKEKIGFTGLSPEQTRHVFKILWGKEVL